MGILSWIILGLVAGALAKLVMPGKDPGGIIITILIGIGGALLGGLVAAQLGFEGVSGFDVRSLGVALAGSVLLLLIYRLVMKKKD